MFEQPSRRFSITALPSWASSPSLIDVARSVDEIVVQVHAVRAPTIFDANTAWRDLARFTRAIRASDGTSSTTPSSREPSPALRVALPTYAAVVRDVEVSVDPDDVARFATKLRSARDTDLARVSGIVWFRLPVDGDEQTWSRATFARVVDGVVGTHDNRATIELVAHGDQRFDVVVSNTTSTVVEMPRMRIAGDIGDADMVMGYRAAGPGTWDAPRRTLARDERIVVGWIHGKDVTLVD